MAYETIREAVRYIGVYDETLPLFESQYPVPLGMAYNSYLILDQQVAVFDTVDRRATDQWLQNLTEALEGRSPDYLVVSHAEPDHAANVARLCGLYPQLRVVGNGRTFAMLEQFFGPDFLPEARRLAVTEGDTLSLGRHRLQFMLAPMVHWPEVMVTYEQTEQILFSADAFGRFGGRQYILDWAGEARRYYGNIVGKYGAQVRALLQKAQQLPIRTLCPLHGPVRQGDEVAETLAFYRNWSSCTPDRPNTVLVAYASVHGHTAAAALRAAELLRQQGVEVMQVDLNRTHGSWVVALALMCGKWLLASATCDGEMMPSMAALLSCLKAKNFRNRTVALLENGCWTPAAARKMTEALAQMPDMRLVGSPVTVRGALNETSEAALAELCRQLAEAE